MKPTNISPVEAADILAPLAWTSADPATGSRGNYCGDDLSGYVIATTNRDAGSLARSNFAVIAGDMGEACEIHRTGHWACGWIEWLILPYGASDADKVKAAEWIAALERYPVADDEHLSELEYQEAAEYWAHASMRERIELAAKWHLSPFVARRDELPETNTGELCTW